MKTRDRFGITIWLWVLGGLILFQDNNSGILFWIIMALVATALLLGGER